MQLPIKVVSQNVELNPTEREAIAAAAAKLETFFDRVISCRVTVSQPNRRPRNGPVRYQVRVNLKVPGEELVVTHPPHAHILDAIQDAFHVAGRQLQDYARRPARSVPPHPRSTPAHGQVLRVFPWEGYGFLQDEDGREIYFHRNSVLNGAFDALEAGTTVRFAEEDGKEGPQASTVEVARARYSRG